MLTSTRTHTTLWDAATVDEVMQAASYTLEHDMELRRAHISPRNLLAMEARIKLLHGLWSVLLEPAPEQ